MYFELPNLHFDFDHQHDRFVATYRGQNGFDHIKLNALMAGAELLSLRAAGIRFLIVGPNAGWFGDVVRTLGEMLGIRVDHVVAVSSVRSLAFGERDFNFVIDMGTSETEADALASRFMTPGDEPRIYFAAAFAERRREDAMITKRSQVERARDAGFAPIFVTYTALFGRGMALPDVESPQRYLTVEAQMRCLFVVGHARSASSLVSSILNELPDVLISYEANADIRKNRHAYLENFNRNSQQAKRPVSKGFYLPAAGPAKASLCEVYGAFLDRYRLFGDKMAYGSRDAFYDPHPANSVFNFVTEWFPFARLIVTLRHPRSGIAAMARMRPNLSAELVCDFWLGGVTRMIDLFLISDSAVLCFHERILEGELGPIEKIAETDLTAVRGLVKPGNVTTDEKSIDAYWGARDEYLRSVMQKASEQYDDLRNYIDATTGRLSDATCRPAVSDIRIRLAQIYSDFIEEMRVRFPDKDVRGEVY